MWHLLFVLSFNFGAGGGGGDAEDKSETTGNQELASQARIDCSPLNMGTSGELGTPRVRRSSRISLQGVAISKKWEGWGNRQRGNSSLLGRGNSCQPSRVTVPLLPPTCSLLKGALQAASHPFLSGGPKKQRKKAPDWLGCPFTPD